MKMKSLLAFISVFLITAVGCSPAVISQENQPTDTTASAIVSDTQTPTDSDQITDSVTTSLETERLPEETSPPSPDVPDQSYVGTWFMDETKEEYIRIYEITSDSIKFATGPVYTTAISVNEEWMFGDGISPKYSGHEGIIGKLRFERTGITVIFDSLGSFDPTLYHPVGTHLTYTIKNEIDIIDWPSDDLSEPVASTIQKTIDELESKGWTDIEVTPHEPESEYRWGIVLEPYEVEEGCFLYSVTGRSDKTYIVANIVFESEDMEGERANIYYVALSGWDLRDSYLESFLRTLSKPNEIMMADDKDLYDFLWGANDIN